MSDKTKLRTFVRRVIGLALVAESSLCMERGLSIPNHRVPLRCVARNASTRFSASAVALASYLR